MVIDISEQILTKTVKFAWAPKWQSLLSNGTINKPANNFNTGIIYGRLLFAFFCHLPKNYPR
jgi:hypothetical protein